MGKNDRTHNIVDMARAGAFDYVGRRVGQYIYDKGKRYIQPSVKFLPRPVRRNPGGGTTVGGPQKEVKLLARGKRRIRGNAAGFLTTRKVKKTALRKFSKRGVDYSLEVGGSTTATDCMYIGHSSAPIERVIENGLRAVFKDMMLKAQFDVSDITAPIGLTVLDTIQVLYQDREGGALQTVAKAAVVADTILSLTAWFIDSTRPWSNENNSTSDQYVFHSIALLLGDTASTIASPVLLMMKHCRLKYDSKSALKMQNRTVSNTANNEADDVDNVPLSGRSYEGKGTGTLYIRKPTAAGAQPTFVASAQTGMILLKPGASYNAPLEPPLPGNFEKVTREGKVQLNPGEIKTSKLSWSGGMSFNDMWQITHPHGAGTTTIVRRKIGTFRFFAIEKMIHFTSGVAELGIQTVYEHQYDMGCVASYSRSVQSVKYFQAIRDVNL